MKTRNLTLASGLRCQLHHQPDAHQAAALIRVEAGSLDEDDNWPGLAHLMEHVLFCGSAGFSPSESLISWVPLQAGQFNATTQLKCSAFFFQVVPLKFEDGLHRLCDMLAFPLLSLQAIVQEITVIDAEYRLLQNHPDTLSQAALFEPLSARFRRFRVGSREAFGTDFAALQTALHHYHHRFYHASGMQLWLQGPQSLDQLEKLAERYAALIPVGRKTADAKYFPVPTDDRQLRLNGTENFWLTLMLHGCDATLRGHIALLNTLCMDEAPGGLMAHLRAEKLCDSLKVQWLWQDPTDGWLALCFSGTKITPEMTQRIESLFWQYLSRVDTCSTNTLLHYLQLSRKDFVALSPLEQLRGHALNFAPTAFSANAFLNFIAAIPRKSCSRLLTQRNLRGQTHQSQGFELCSFPWIFNPLPLPARAAFSLYSPTITINSTQSPVETLLLRPAFYQGFNEAEAQTYLHRLRPILAMLRHREGDGRWRQADGVWQLELDLPAIRHVEAMTCVRQAINVLKTKTLTLSAGSTPDIAIRQLLNVLPEQLLESKVKPEWLFAWCGENEQLHDEAASLLAGFAYSPSYPIAPPQLRGGITHIDCGSTDSALLVFIPLLHRDDTSLAALRVLALLLEPRFFNCLRVKQQIGYVVSARYRRVADVDGLQFALQSPSKSWRRLLGYCMHFLKEMSQEPQSFYIADLSSLQTTLLNEYDGYSRVDIAMQTLRCEHDLPCLTPKGIMSLNSGAIEQLMLQCIEDHRHWRILTAGP